MTASVSADLKAKGLGRHPPQCEKRIFRRHPDPRKGKRNGGSPSYSTSPYSYARSVQNGALSARSPQRQTRRENISLPLDNLYTAGEYLFVFDGVTAIKASKNDNAYVFADGAYSKGAAQHEPHPFG